jgi:hypothetical protein
VSVGAEGRLDFAALNSPAGGSVGLRFEMDTLVLLHTCAHPMDMAEEFPRKPVRLWIGPAAPMAEDDVCLMREENRRGFENNRLYHQ